MKTRTKVSYIFLLFLGVIFASVQSSNSEKASLTKRDFVPDEKTAVKIAEAIWIPIYGEEIYNKRPFIAKLNSDNVWVVYGTLPDEATGGVPYIEIQKKDCKILKVTHGK